MILFVIIPSNNNNNNNNKPIFQHSLLLPYHNNNINTHSGIVFRRALYDDSVAMLHQQVANPRAQCGALGKTFTPAYLLYE